MCWLSCFKSITGCHPPHALHTLECLEIYLRLRSSEALGKSALAFPASSMSPGGIIFPRESEAEGVDSLYASTPPQTDTGTDCGEARPHPSCYSYAFPINVDVYYGEHPHGSEPDICLAPEGL